MTRTQMIDLVSGHARRGLCYTSDIEDGYISNSVTFMRLKRAFETKYPDIALSYKEGVVTMIGVRPLNNEQAEERSMDKLLETYDILNDLDRLCGLARHAGDIDIKIAFTNQVA